jgi:hypothetical protein
VLWWGDLEGEITGRVYSFCGEISGTKSSKGEKNEEKTGENVMTIGFSRFPPEPIPLSRINCQS